MDVLDVPSLIFIEYLCDDASHFYPLDLEMLRQRCERNFILELWGARISYSNFGDDDITDLISRLPLTQPDFEEKPPGSASSSERGLGKRKASDMSTSTESGSSQGPPAKVSKPNPLEDKDNPFIDVPEVPDDPRAPISFSPPMIMQHFMNSKKLPYGVQYEIARFISVDSREEALRLKYSNILTEQVTELASLVTNEAAVPATFKVIFKKKSEIDDEDEERWKRLFAKEHAAKDPWQELDREEAALLNDPYGGLGFKPTGESLEWHGGQVLFHGKLHDISPKNCKKEPKYKMTLEPAELGPSNMFARRFGSKHFFRLKLTKGVLNKSAEHLMTYLQKPLLLCSGVFRAFYAKDTNVFYVKTNERTDGTRVLVCEPPIQNVYSFLEFLEWHNPMKLNMKQTMAKYVSRFALGLSNSVPGLMLKRPNIHFIEDIISETGSNMTDGAGKINRWSLKQIRHRLDWEDRPTAIQTRIFGTKGLLIDDGKNADEFGFVQLTPSQRKIIFPEGGEIDPAHRIIDVLRASHMKTPCRLSVETIINLSENGVPKEAFVQLLRQSLEGMVLPLLDWESKDAMRKLWCNVRHLGGVMHARRAREEAGLARAKGYSERDADDNELEDEDGFSLSESAETQRSSAWWGDEVSGCPSSLEETVMCMIDSGFTPQECPVLRDKLQKFITGRVKEYIRSYRIDVPMSATGFLVPDTSGVLEPGEVFFKSSRRQFKNPDGTETDIYTGDVLLTRHPCKLPTDIQKWKSVDRPELRHHVDVIVFSTKGPRRAADYLSGGDYDGDKGIYIYQPELVNLFKNADERFSNPPKDIEKYFKPHNEQVVAFQERTAALPVEEQIRELQKFLLSTVRDTTIVGKYSNYHEMALYTLGYCHKETIRLAYMFCMTLDGIKTGMSVLPETEREDAKKYNKRAPRWKETEEERDRKTSNETNAKRPRELGRFIMDELHNKATTEGENWLVRIGNHFKSVASAKTDEALVEPYRKALEMCRRWATEEGNHRPSEDLKKLEEHVRKVYDDHRTEMSSPKKTSRSSPKKDKGSFTDQPIEVRQDKIRELSRRFADFPKPGELMMHDEEVARIRASYAYYYDCERRRGYDVPWSRFPFDVAMRELCAIKARAAGRYKVVDGGFYDHFNMKHPNKHHF
ncbi:unnamed protein product [Cyclocybe aegerita]|uniref:RNA-dependent RNA polymerase n=1 Tax=Cyclocybe aegerita TaxID=1973307 RepID=A0A8S0VWX2_CYCAE|nr:unnamed protein product [Cyclocybe aegerita]